MKSGAFLTCAARHALHAVVKPFLPILGNFVLERWAKCQRLTGLLGKQFWMG